VYVRAIMTDATPPDLHMLNVVVRDVAAGDPQNL
jgi:hypothetical protein